MINLEYVGFLPKKTIICKDGYYTAENMKGLVDFYNLANNKGIIKDEKEVAYDVSELTKKINKSNTKGKNQTIYPTKIIEDSNYKDRYFILADKLNRASVLITNPCGNDTCKYYTNYTMEEIKYLLTHTDTNGKNLLEKVKAMSPNKVKKLLPLIDMYDEQLEKQFEEYYRNDRERLRLLGYMNIFTYKQKEKMEEVEEYLKYIVEYLTDTATSEYIWGIASSGQKKLLLSAINNDNDIRYKLIKTIANYTAPSEDKTSPYVLKRFIKK